VYPLQLNANPEGWRIFSARKADKAFLAFSKKVYRRDNYACQFCGFQAREYQEIINVDQNYFNNKLSNLATACCFCTQCFFLDAVGVGGYGGGTLIYMPEISQNNLDSFCHVLFCAIANDTGYKNTAQNIYRSFKLRAQAIEEQFGEGTSNPGIFGQLLIESRSKESQYYDTLMNDLRLLPSRAAFRTQIERWAETALSELAVEE
jgi:intracellular multiplication protein IcmJ